MKSNKRLKQIIVLIVFVLLSLFGSSQFLNNGCLEPQSGYTQDFVDELKSNTLTVSRVIDGDTIEVVENGEIIKFRLIGIDTPETVHPEKPVECFGEEAKAELKRLLDGEEIYFNYDNAIGQSDRYGRTLVYVWRANDDLFINQYMLSEGYANFYENTVPVYFDADFRELENQAREEGRGLWGEVCEI